MSVEGGGASIIYVTKVTDSNKTAGDRPAHEIEVTPEMIEAGLPALCRYHYDGGDLSEDVVRHIFISMLSVTSSESLERAARLRGSFEVGLERSET